LGDILFNRRGAQRARERRIMDSSNERRTVVVLMLATLGGIAFLPRAVAQQAQVFAYPNAGQSQEQQNRDRYECHQWSVAQTGFDPSTAAPLPAPPPNPGYGYADTPPPPPPQKKGGFLGLGNGGLFQGGGMVGDAATGAALGAAGGAIAGNAGQGAAIGALASTVFGAVSRSTRETQSASSTNAAQQQYQQQQYQQQMQAQSTQAYQDRMRRVGDYNQAYAACMKARNYTVN
jgi:hypothetical protein